MNIAKKVGLGLITIGLAGLVGDYVGSRLRQNDKGRMPTVTVRTPDPCDETKLTKVMTSESGLTQVYFLGDGPVCAQLYCRKSLDANFVRGSVMVYDASDFRGVALQEDVDGKYASLSIQLDSLDSSMGGKGTWKTLCDPNRG